MTSASDLAYWLEVTADLLQQSLTEFPAAQLAAHLHHSFELTSLSWEWHETEGDFGFVQFADDPFTPCLLEAFHAQLSIAYRIQGVFRGAFVLTRANEDFTPDERELARRLQPLFAGLYVQVRARGGAGCSVPSTSAAQVGLTGTEIAVLSLLTQGYTAHGIATRLTTSPRTVHKHLEHIYRKLGVTDRLMAVRVATEMGLGPGWGFDQDAAKSSVAVLGHGGPHPA